MDLQQSVRTISKEILRDVIRIRRHLHMYPELSFEEQKTSAFVCAELDALNIPYQANVGGYGVVATIYGNNPKAKLIALRADMDALPITEVSTLDYASKNQGVMHACGHDVHTASLLGTARIVQQLKDHWSGQIRLLFQPAEERMPGGAIKMIEQGVLENPRPAAVIGQHVHPEFEVGTVGFRSGAMMASADEIYIDVLGKGGHGALPHNTIDPVVIASHIIIQLQNLVSRVNNPILPSVLTIGKIESVGGSTNVIPNAVRLQGTFRTFDEQWRNRAHRMIEDVARSTAMSFGATVEVHIIKGYPALYSDPNLTEALRAKAIDYLGPARVQEMPIRMTAEDFAYYALERPACFYRLGTANKNKGITSPVHTNTFDIDEDVLALSTGLMAWLAIGR